MGGIRKVISSQFFEGIQFGYIIIPPDTDREPFIEQCYRWERVSILIDGGGGVYHECYIGKSSLREIIFPQTSSQLGSCILFFIDPFRGHPIIIGVVSKEDESDLLKEGQFKITKTFGEGIITIIGDAKNGVLNLLVEEGELTELNILATNTNKDAKINIRSSGQVKVEVDDKFVINQGEEPLVKGTELKSELDTTNAYLQTLQAAISSALGAIDIVAGSTGKVVFDAAMSGQSPGDYSDINSEKAFTD